MCFIEEKPQICVVELRNMDFVRLIPHKLLVVMNDLQSNLFFSDWLQIGQLDQWCCPAGRVRGLQSHEQVTRGVDTEVVGLASIIAQNTRDEIMTRTHGYTLV